MAVSGVGEVQVRDLETGTLRHRLTGHAGTGSDIAAVYSPDGSRLFTRGASDVRSPQAAVVRTQVHVWDTATGRELLTLPVDDDTAEFTPVARSLELVGGELRVPVSGGTRVYDGTPGKP